MQAVMAHAPTLRRTPLARVIDARMDPGAIRASVAAGPGPRRHPQAPAGACPTDRRLASAGTDIIQWTRAATRQPQR